MTTIAELRPPEQLEAALNESFVQLSDGCWYPLTTGIALVRVMVLDDSYTIQRRRNHRSPWMPIVNTLVAEFDRNAFSQWASSWSLVEQ